MGALFGTGGAEAVCGIAGGAPAPIPGMGGLAMPPPIEAPPLGLLAIQQLQHPNCLFHTTLNTQSYQLLQAPTDRLSALS